MLKSVKKSNYKIQKLSELLSIENGEQFFKNLCNSFQSKNTDVEKFLKNSSIQASRMNTAATYLVYQQSSDVDIDLVGYFSLAMKMLSIKKSVLSCKSERIIKRFGYYDEDAHSYQIPAILIAQFGKNFNHKSKSISGDELMNITLNQVKSILSQISGKTIFLECENIEKLLAFYKDHDFISLDNTVTSSNKKKLLQLYRLV